MNKIFLIFCIISTTAFSHANDNSIGDDGNTPVEQVSSSVPDVWEVSTLSDLKVENSIHKIIVKKTLVSVACVYGDGEYTLGTTTSTETAAQMINHCWEQGGVPFVGEGMK